MAELPRTHASSRLTARGAHAFAAAVVVMALSAGASAVAQGPPPASLAELPHVVLTLGAGGQLRLGSDSTFAQETRAPSYADAMVGMTFPVAGMSIGLALGSSVNLESDGGYTEPVFAWQQWALAPSLLLYYPLGLDWLALVHAGPSFALQGPSAVGRDDDRRSAVTLGSAGLELGATGGYRLLAGVLLYAELDLNMWVGEGGSRHWVSALEAGLMLDYEVLP